MSENSAKSVTIIGGGFAGTALAIQLMHRYAKSKWPNAPLAINIVEKDESSFLGGKAYSPTGAADTIRPEFNTNSTFVQLSLFQDDSRDCAQFLFDAKNWLEDKSLPNYGVFKKKYAEITGQPFPPEIADKWLKDLATRESTDVAPRWFYRLYLEARYKEAFAVVQAAHPAFKANVVYGEAVDVESSISADGLQKVVVKRTDGQEETFQSQAVVLATGYLPSLPKPFLRGDIAGFENDPNYIGDSMQDAHKLRVAMQGNSRTVFIAGMGLTAEDVVMMAHEDGFFRRWGNRVLMYSRHGLHHEPPDPHKRDDFSLQFDRFRAELDRKVRNGDERALARFLIGYWKRVSKKYNGLSIYNGIWPYIDRIKDHLVRNKGFSPDHIELVIDEARSALTTSFAPNAARNAAIMDKLMWKTGHDATSLEILARAAKALTRRKKVVRAAGAIDYVKCVRRHGKIQFKIAFKPTGFSRPAPVYADVFVDATGNAESLNALRQSGRMPALFGSLLDKGLITPFAAVAGAIERGVAVNEDRQVLDKNGKPSDWLYAIGVPAAGVALHRENRFGTNAANVATIRRNMADVALSILEQIGILGSMTRPVAAPAVAPAIG
jgi:uncharacterized NAD(P)/FAD-binding protein YdhS